MVKFDIQFNDLTPEAKARLMETFQASEEEARRECFPLAVIGREDDDENAQISIRVFEWREFSKRMESYIAGHTLEKYEFPGKVDFMEISKTRPIINIWNVLKYTLRIWNGHGKSHDVEKIAHYAQRYWTLTHDFESSSIE